MSIFEGENLKKQLVDLGDKCAKDAMRAMELTLDLTTNGPERAAVMMVAVSDLVSFLANATATAAAMYGTMTPEDAVSDTIQTVASTALVRAMSHKNLNEAKAIYKTTIEKNGGPAREPGYNEASKVRDLANAILSLCKQSGRSPSDTMAAIAFMVATMIEHSFEPEARAHMVQVHAASITKLLDAIEKADGQTGQENPSHH